MDYDEDYAFGLTQIEWDKKQRKNLTVGFMFIGTVIALSVGITIWFFHR